MGLHGDLAGMPRRHNDDANSKVYNAKPRHTVPNNCPSSLLTKARGQLNFRESELTLIKPPVQDVP